MEPEMPQQPNEAEVPSQIENHAQRPERGLSWVFLGEDGLRAGWSISLFVALTALFTIVLSTIIKSMHLMQPGGGFKPVSAIVGEVAGLISIAAAAQILALIEGRGSLLAYNLRGPRKAVNFLSGAAMGFAALSVLVGLLTLGGWLHFGAVGLSGFEIARYGLLWAVAFLFVGLFEEGLFRCYLQATLTRGLNFWTALALVVLMCVATAFMTHGEGGWGVYLIGALGVVPCLMILRMERQWNQALAEYYAEDECCGGEGGCCGGACEGCGEDEEGCCGGHCHEGEEGEGCGQENCHCESEGGCCGEGEEGCSGDCCGCGEGDECCEGEDMPFLGGAGFWYAAWVTSTLFGFVHTSNAGENGVGIFSAALIGLAFVFSIWLTGTAWWAIGCHMAWDWAETFFYGTADSGNVATGHFLTTQAAGNSVWSGGADGPEGSVLVIPVVLLLAAALWFFYGRDGQEQECCEEGCGCGCTVEHEHEDGPEQ